jgi:mercuric ion binding protein
MKSIKIFLTSFAFLLALTVAAQTKTEKLAVNGECGTCKKKIEAAAKQAGATYAVWNKDTKQLVVKYDAASSNTEKIEQSIAHAGYDTQDVKATDDAYSNLDDCCKYQRIAVKAKSVKAAECKKDGTCKKDMACCKDATADCCKDSH